MFSGGVVNGKSDSGFFDCNTLVVHNVHELLSFLNGHWLVGALRFEEIALGIGQIDCSIHGVVDVNHTVS